MTMQFPDGVYGRDLATVATDQGLDLDPAMLEATGINVLAQSLLRRQTMGRGTAIGYPNDGYDVRALLGDGLSSTNLANEFFKIQQELLRDQRVQAATVTGNYDSDTKKLTLIEQIQSTGGPFTLTLSVDSVTVSILRLSAT